MAQVVIAGIAEDEVFQHVAYVANYLTKVLPDFNVQQISKKSEQWDAWIKQQCKKNGWHYFKSPIIWKEMAMSGGNAVLLGGASEFWEYLKEYYDILSYFNKNERAALCLDKFKLFLTEENQKKQLYEDFSVRHVCVVGAGHPMTAFLVMEMLRLPELALKDGLIVTLCDAKEFRPALKRLASDAAAIPASPGLGTVRVVASLKTAVSDCDVCIVLQHLDCERNKMDLVSWLSYNHDKMLCIAEALKARAPRKCRVILAGTGDVPLCFNAHVIMDHVPNLLIRNIVAVTADLAIETLGTLANAAGVPQATVGLPSVWGFIGLNKMVDLHSAYHVVEVFRPNPDCTKKYMKGTTIYPGSSSVEVRKMMYLLNHKNNIHLQILAKKLEIMTLVDRNLYLAKVRATIDLLKHWFSDEKTNACLSLGVCSNGTFGLPQGLYFSQPVTLVDGFWKPFKAYPAPLDFNCRLVDLMILPFHILKLFYLGKRTKGIWLLSDAQREEVRKKRVELFQRYVIDKRKKLLECWRLKMKDMALEQKTLARTTANKVTEIEEELKRKAKDEKEKQMLGRITKLKRQKLIAILKEQRQESKSSTKEMGGEETINENDDDITKTEGELREDDN